MKVLKNTLAASAALAMIGAPVVAQAAERSASPVKDSEELAGSGLVIGLIAAALVVVGIIVVSDSDDGEPVSP